ncbi:receptor-like kinase LIP2 isoform X3 [Euphorbia lathyris]|uniref:receptor-like kinase LIP2 isoform X3 n=1 Tax=Euphorbia lathyris TaxID=212925 RepID=UPI0033132830
MKLTQSSKLMDDDEIDLDKSIDDGIHLPKSTDDGGVRLPTTMDDDGVGLDNSMDDYGFDLDISIENDTVDLDKTVDDGEGTDLYESMDNDFIRATGARKFSYNALVQATNNFSEEEKLGEGGFGAVYKGFLKELNCSVAVKRVSRDSKQGIKEYAYEVKIISQLRHRNVVKLIGWCHEKKELLLVYEFMSNGSLDSHIFKESSLLTWEIRYKIALGLALGLRYLQEELEQYVIHRDIKASNVMLDPDFNPKLGDFGLARLVKQGRGPNETPLAGTPGYVAPEYATTGKASKESDVYSFGIVALEIACGRKIIDRKAREDQINLKEWVWDLYGEGKLLEAADPRLNGDFDKQQVERLMIVGLWCAHPDSKLRPTIEKAIHVLNYVAPLPDLPSKMPLVSYFAPFSMSSSSADLVGINNSSLTDLVPARNNFSEQVKVRKTNFGALYKGFLRLRELNSYIGVKKGSNDDRRSRPKVSSNPMEIDPRVQNNSEKLITFLTYKELITYTDGLSVRNLIGSGTLGYIYHGIIKGKWKRNLNGQHIAIQFSRSEDERATILWQNSGPFMVHPQTRATTTRIHMEAITEQLKAPSAELTEQKSSTETKLSELQIQISDEQRVQNQRIKALFTEQTQIRKEQFAIHQSLLTSHKNLETLVQKTITTISRMVEPHSESISIPLKTHVNHFKEKSAFSGSDGILGPTPSGGFTGFTPSGYYSGGNSGTKVMVPVNKMLS